MSLRSRILPLRTLLIVSITAGVILGNVHAAAPVITQSHPPTAFFTENSPIFLRSSASGATRYQWSRNGVPLPNATNPAYEGPVCTPALTGVYTFTAFNGTESVTDSPIMVLLVIGQKKEQNIVNKGGSVTLTTSVYPVSEIPNMTFQWKHDRPNETDFTGFGTVSGQNSLALKFTNIQPVATQSYYCQITHQGVYGEAIAPTYITVRQKPAVDQVDDINTVVGGYVAISLNVLNDPLSVSVANLPPGLVFLAHDNVIEGYVGKAGDYAVKVTGRNVVGAGTPITFHIHADAFPDALKGTYEGIIAPESINDQLGGKLSLTVTATGACTASITLGFDVYRMTGKVTVEDNKASAAVNLSVNRPRLSPLHLDLALNGVGEILLTSVSDANGSAAVDAAHVQGTGGSLAGAYHACYEKPFADSSAAAFYPVGSGFAKVTVAASGLTTWVNTLADGTAVTLSAHLITPATGNPLFYLYAPLPGKAGSVVGKGTVDSDSHLAGSINWTRLPSKPVAGRSRLNVILNDINLSGGRWIAPKAGELLPGYAPGTNNAQIIVTPLNVDTDEQLTQDFTLLAKNQLQTPLTQASTANGGITLKITPGTGIISGSVKLNDGPLDAKGKPASRTGNFQALIVPGTNGEGHGFIMLPGLPNILYPGTSMASTPLLSMKVLIQPKPAAPPSTD